MHLLRWQTIHCEERETGMGILMSIARALSVALSMLWEVLWPLILGFALSGIVQAVVSHQAMAKTLGCDGPKGLPLRPFFR